METLDLSNAHSDVHTRRALTDLSLVVAKSKRIVVVTGAGISCSSGIPDFRSSDGLYNLVKERYPHAVLKGRDLFCSSLFRDATSTSVFYTFIAQLKRSIDDAQPGPTHRFLRTLDQKGRLLRSYTQNIDGFEDRLGLAGPSRDGKSAGATAKGKGKLRAKDVRNVQLHGDIHRVRCTLCAADMPCTSVHLDVFDAGGAPDCPECAQRSLARVERSARALKVGRLRPAIVLYDEPHPLGEDIGLLAAADCARKPGALVVMGTSLKVHGLKALVRDFARGARAAARPGKVIFVNRTPPPAEWAGVFDYWVCGETDEWCSRVEADWRRLRPQDWEIQQTLDGPGPSVGLKAQKATAVAATKKSKAATNKFALRDTGAAADDVSDAENAPPPSQRLALFPTSQESAASAPLFSPLPSPASAPVTPPCSPSKRRRSVMQYDSPGRGSSPPPPASSPLSSPARSAIVAGASEAEWTDVECSPSKRHKARGMLFGDVTNSPAAAPVATPRPAKVAPGAADVFGTPLKSAGAALPKGRKRDARTAVGSPAAARARAQPRTRTAVARHKLAVLEFEGAPDAVVRVEADAGERGGMGAASASRKAAAPHQLPTVERGQARMKAYIDLPAVSRRRAIARA